MTPMIQQAVRTVRTLLPPTGSVTTEQIEMQVDVVLAIPQYSGVDRDALIREVQSIYNIRIDDFRIIEASERRRPWISDKKASINWTFWNRYRDYLQTEKNYSDTVVSQIDRLTDRTLDGLFDPSINAAIDKYGLVVGQVQSGKTSNYTGLICKAADAGYKLIIVLAGIHNNLRSQTQLRLDEGFLGFDTQHQRAFDRNNIWIGVGRIDQNGVAHSLTSSQDRGDFTAGAANSLGINFNTNEPIVAVVKKNYKVLERLLAWLNAQSIEIDGKRVIRNKSLLLVDDEADNASINTNPENDAATKINTQIRNILGLFDKSGYVGYTATPFANIFIPINDDLFPKDFIVNLPAPTNYIGPDRIFGLQPTEDDDASTVLPIVRRIEDYQHFVPDGHKSGDALPSEVPDSMRMAIKCFIITCAIRRLRGQANSHNSMLVHVSRFIAWQGQIKVLVENVFDFYRRGIEMNIPTVIDEIRKAFEEDSGSYKSFVTTSQQILNSALREIDTQVTIHEWRDVLIHLNDAASRIQVREINGGSADALSYYDHTNGLSVIAIGGDKLSRGLTLEGLSVSYYLRASRMYDTLMQMGRWFGYRPGYVDLCRLFTSRELNEWFCHITLASEELRDEFDYMADVAGSTPEQYALRVRTHPGVLQISASNKIRRAHEVRISWSGRLVETYQLSKKPEIVQKNLQTTIQLVEQCGNGFIAKSNFFLWERVPMENIREFLNGFSVYDNLKSAAPNNLMKFIEFKYGNNELTEWNVAIVSKNRGKDFKVTESINVKMIERTQSESSTDELYFIRKSHIISPDDEFVDLSDDELARARVASQRIWEEKGNTTPVRKINGNWVRNEIRKPSKVLLVLYFLDPEKAGLQNVDNPVVGFAISFPGTNRNDAVSYAVHKQLLPAFHNEESHDDEPEEDED